MNAKPTMRGVDPKILRVTSAALLGFNIHIVNTTERTSRIRPMDEIINALYAVSLARMKRNQWVVNQKYKLFHCLKLCKVLRISSNAINIDIVWQAEMRQYTAGFQWIFVPASV